MGERIAAAGTVDAPMTRSRPCRCAAPAGVWSAPRDMGIRRGRPHHHAARARVGSVKEGEGEREEEMKTGT